MKQWTCPKCEKVWEWELDPSYIHFAEENPEYCPNCLPSPPTFGDVIEKQEKICENCTQWDKKECPVKCLRFIPPHFGEKLHNTPPNFGCVWWAAK